MTVTEAGRRLHFKKTRDFIPMEDSSSLRLLLVLWSLEFLLLFNGTESSKLCVFNCVCRV